MTPEDKQIRSTAWAECADEALKCGLLSELESRILTDRNPYRSAE